MTVDRPFQISQMGRRWRNLRVHLAERVLQRRLLTRTQQQGHPVVTSVQNIPAVQADVTCALDVPANLSKPTNVTPQRRQNRLGVTRIAGHPGKPAGGNTVVTAVGEREQDPDQPFHSRGLVSTCCSGHDSPHRAPGEPAPTRTSHQFQQSHSGN